MLLLLLPMIPLLDVAADLAAASLPDDLGSRCRCHVAPPITKVVA